MSGCIIDECGKRVVNKMRGLCNSHYHRYLDHGDPRGGNERPGRALVPLAERFWPKVDIRGDDDCWEWQAARSTHFGYGIIGVGSRITGDARIETAHRVAWRLTYGEIPESDVTAHGSVIMHMCDNPPCVNPKHLRLGTQLDNIADRHSKRRDARHKERRLAASNA